MNKELEEAKKRLKILLTDSCDCEECIKDKRAYKTVLQALDNSISKEVIEKKKNQMLEEYKEVIKTNSNKAFYMKCQIEFAEELLKGG